MTHRNCDTVTMELLVLFLFLSGSGCTAFILDPEPEPGAAVRFLTLGDWGGISFHPYTTPVQTSVSEQMARVAEKEHVTFSVMLGDNFYLYGVSSVDDPRFNETFENVYSSASLQHPWYVIAGNHDYFGNVSAQILYTKRSNRWNFPDYYHSVHRAIPGVGGKTLDIFLLDTIQLCGNVYSMNTQPAGPADVPAAETQWAWLEQKLNQSTANYVVVGGHYPIYSVAEHGGTDCLRQRLEPMLYRYNVTVYVAGHDHNIQHISMQSSGKHLDHFIIGAGNFVNKVKNHMGSIPEGALRFFWAELLYLGGFSYWEATNDHLKVKIIDGIGKTRYEHAMSPRF